MKTAEELREAQRSPLTASAPGLPDSSVKSLVDRLMIWMPGLSDVEARYAIMDCARDFCDRTNCWTAEPGWPMEGMDFARMVSFPDVPNGATVLRVRESRCGAWTWRGLPPFVEARFLPGPNPDFLFHGIPPDILSLRMRAAALGGDVPMFHVRLVLAPFIGSEDLPSALVARWGNAFVEGARAKLCLMENRPWRDQQEAALCGGRYNSFVNRARSEFETGSVPSHLQTRSKIPFVI